MGTNARIASLDIALRGNTTNLDGALDKAGVGLKNFRDKVNATVGATDVKISSIGSSISEAFSNALTNPIGAIKSLASIIGNAFLHPIETTKNLIGTLLTTFRGVGDQVLAAIKAPFASMVSSAIGSIKTIISFVGGMATVVMRFGSGLVSVFTRAFSIIASIVKPILVPVVLAGWTVVMAALTALAKGSNVVLNVVLAGWTVVKTMLSALTKVPSILLTVVLTGWTVVKAALTALTKIPKIILTVVLTGWTVVKTILSSLTKIPTVVLNVVLGGWSVVKTILASLRTIPALVLTVVLAGWEFVKAAISVLYRVPKLVIRLGLAGYEYAKAAIKALYKIPDLAIRVTVGGWDAIKSGISGIKAALSTLASGVKTALNPTALVNGLSSIVSGVGSAISALMGMVSVSAVVATGIGAIVVAGVAVVAGILGIAAAGLYLANQQAPIMQAMHQTAQTLGMSTKAFSGLASTSGMEVEKFGKGVITLQRTLGEAALQGGGTADALHRVGLSARELVNLSPEDQMRRIAHALKNVGNQADRIRLSQKLFGEEAGFDFTRILQNGSEGLNTILARSDRFGLQFTESQAEAVKQSNKAWSEWSQGLTGVGRSLAVAFSPAWQMMGEALGSFFGKISQWVRASLPYFEMFWTVVNEIIADVKAELEPFWSWLDSSIASLGQSIGSFIQGSIPFIRQSWNIIKAIFSVAWGFLVAGWNAVVSIVKPVIESFVTQVQSWLGSLGGWLIGENMATWDQFKDAMLKVFIALEFGIRRWKDVASVIWDQIRLKMFEWLSALSPVATGLQNFINAIIDGFNAMNTALARTFQSTINSIIDGYNAVAGALDMDTIDVRVDVDARQLDRVSIGIADMTATITQLREQIRQQYGALGADLDAFITERLAQLNRTSNAVANTVRQQSNARGNLPKQENKAAEKGSVEAFSIIAGQQGDKMYSALNDIIRELRTNRELDRQQLRELQARANLAIARL